MVWYDKSGAVLNPYTMIDGSLIPLSGSSTMPVNDPNVVTFVTTGSVFSPKVEATSGSVEWLDQADSQLAVGLTPTIDFGSTNTRTVKMRVIGGDGLDSITSINLGFDSSQDVGRYGPGAGHNHPPTPVSSISGLTKVKNLKIFMAAQSGLTGHVDFSGLSNLEYIECFGARVQNVNLQGCTSLIRLCLEQNSLEYLDLNPVAGTLRDLRAADQTTYGYEFATQTMSLENLYHYCVRNGVIVNSIPHAMMPVIEERWDWDNHLTTIDAPISPLLKNYNTYGNPYSQETVDRILVALDNLGGTNGYILIAREWGPETPSAPSSIGLAARDSLLSKGWEVYITQS